MPKSIVKTYIDKKSKTVPEPESKKILQGYGINVPNGHWVHSPVEAGKVAESLGFPVVLKAVSTQVLHKTELQGVMTGLRSLDEVRVAGENMEANFAKNHQKLEGFLLEEMVSKGSEFIVGVDLDDTFGPVLMLGTGGIFINLLNDVTFRSLPVYRKDIEEMIDEIRGSAFMRGFRGQPALNKEALIDLMLKIGQLGQDIAGSYESMDFNPIILNEQEAAVLDAKIVLAERIEDLSCEPERPNIKNIEYFFSPINVALVGASTTPGKIGNAVADSLINHDFQGRVFPITKGKKEIFGLSPFEDLYEIPEKVDLVVAVVGLPLIPDLLDQCKDLGIPAMLIISGGGKELGGEQVEVEKRIQDKAKEYGIRIIGPNCVGCYNARNRFDAFFQVHERLERPKLGNISFITQSGTYGCSFLELCNTVGISKMISYGNRVDVDEADMISFLAQDEDTEVIASYQEGLGDGQKFIRTAKEVVNNQRKPIVVYKSGRTKRSAQAAQSHTGAYGGTYAIYRGAFKQSKIITVDSFEELLAVSKALAMQPAAFGSGVAMISNGAGPMVNAIDLFDQLQLEIAQLKLESIQEMEAQFPPFYICKNPIDVTGSATSQDYLFAMESLLKDPHVHIIMNWFVFQDTPLDEGIVEVMGQVNKESNKPLLCGATGGAYTQRMSQAIEENGVPVFSSAYTWVAAANALVEWGKHKYT